MWFCSVLSNRWVGLVGGGDSLGGSDAYRVGGVGVSLFGWVNEWRRVVPSIGGGWLAVVGWVVSRWGLFVVAEWWPRVTAYRTEPRAGAIFKLWGFLGGRFGRNPKLFWVAESPSLRGIWDIVLNKSVILSTPSCK